MIKRIFLFLATNLLVMATISIIMSALGLHHYLSAKGIDYQTLLIFCVLWGMTGSLLSLWMSKFVAKMAMGVVIINPKSATREELFILDIIYNLARKAGLKTMPEVGIYSSPELNAFATGPTKSDALVAVSSGLLTSMNREEVEAVLGHEISHIANGDMVTMTLIQGVVNSFSLFLSRIIAYAISMGVSRDDRAGEFSEVTFTFLTLFFDVIFTLLGSILVAAFSRWREYRADHGGASLVGKNAMISALQRLQQATGIEDERAPSLATLKISRQSTWFSLFSTHPPLEDRIHRLAAMK